MRPYACLVLLCLLGCSRKSLPTQKTTPTSTPRYTNVMIDKAGLVPIGPCEPSISINPRDTEHLVAGAILDQLYVSRDGGSTWTEDQMTSDFGVYGDPVVRFGYEGEVYFAHLSNPTGRAYVDPEFLDRIVVQTSRDGGSTWTDSHPAVRGDKDQDKEWLHSDPHTGTLLMSWTEFDKYGSDSPEHKSRILFAQSKDMGQSWSPPLAISQVEGDCVDSDNTTEGAVPTMLADGTMLVTWSMGGVIYLDRSSDGGHTWLEQDIEVSRHIGGWDIDIPGLGRVNGMPILEADLSDGEHSGRLYINWSDQRHGVDDTDIWLVYSDVQGSSWSEPIRVNDDAPGRHQFFSWMDVDPVTGHIYVVFYDRRHHGDTQTDVYLAYSRDGGQTFTNVKISESPFIPNENVFFGDYNDIAAYDGVIRPIWTRLDTFKLSVWTALIEAEQLP